MPEPGLVLQDLDDYRGPSRWPWLLIGLVLVVAAVGGTWWWRSTTHRPQTVPTAAAPEAAPPATTLTDRTGRVGHAPARRDTRPRGSTADPRGRGSLPRRPGPRRGG